VAPSRVARRLGGKTASETRQLPLTDCRWNGAGAEHSPCLKAWSGLAEGGSQGPGLPQPRVVETSR